MPLRDRRRQEVVPARLFRPSKRRANASLTGAGERMETDGDLAEVRRRSSSDAWRAEAWPYYDMVPQLRYAVGYIGDSFSQVSLRVGWEGEDGEVGPILDEDGVMLAEAIDGGVSMDDYDLANDLVHRLRSRKGGQGALLRKLAQNILMAGECELLGTPGEGNVPIWEVCSTDELRPSSTYTGWGRIVHPGMAPVPIDPKAIVLRIHSPHPRWSELADSPVRANLEVLEELALYSRAARASAVSRLTGGAGVYWIPQEITFASMGGAGASDPTRDQFTDDMMETMARPLYDRSSAASFAPMIARAPGAFIKDIRHDTFDSPLDATLEMRRTDAVGHLAQGLPLPAEVVTGVGGSSHWTAWALDEATVRSHLGPFCEMVTTSVDSAYMHPFLMLGRGIADPFNATVPEGLSRLRIWPDFTRLIIHPNREKAAEAAYGTAHRPNFTISANTARRWMGATETDAPDDAEIEKRIRIAQLVNERVTVRGAETEAQANDQINAGESSGGVEVGAPTTDPTGAAGGTGEDPSGDTAPGATTASLAADLTAYADQAAERAVQRAAAKVRTKLANQNGKSEVPANVLSSDPSVLCSLVGKRIVGPLLAADDSRGIFVREFDALITSTVRRATHAGHKDPNGLACQVAALAEATALSRLFNPKAAVPTETVAALIRGGSRR